VEILGQVGGAAFTLMSLVIGGRLCLLWARTRQLPELLIGGGMLLLAGVGYPISAIVREMPGLTDGTRTLLGALAGLAGAAGLVLSSSFTWLLFRRGVAWANALLGTLAAGAAALWLAESLTGSWAGGGALFWGWLPFLISVCYGWGFLECARYYRMLRRRAAIGLGDPVVTDRFRLYAIGTLLAVIVNVVGQVFWWRGVEMLTDPLGSLLLALLGTGSSVLMCLAFIPPRAYLERVRMRAGAAA
jgi:hypothetical protein